MKLRIRETNELKELHLVNPSTGIDYLSDHFVDRGFTYDYDACEWVGSKDDIEWWEDYCTTIQKDEDTMQDLREEYGEYPVEKAIKEAFNEYDSNDYTQHHDAYQSAIKAVKGSK